AVHRAGAMTEVTSGTTTTVSAGQNSGGFTVDSGGTLVVAGTSFNDDVFGVMNVVAGGLESAARIESGGVLTISSGGTGGLGGDFQHQDTILGTENVLRL